MSPTVFSEMRRADAPAGHAIADEADADADGRPRLFDAGLARVAGQRFSTLEAGACRGQISTRLPSEMFSRR